MTSDRHEKEKGNGTWNAPPATPTAAPPALTANVPTALPVQSMMMRHKPQCCNVPSIFVLHTYAVMTHTWATMPQCANDLVIPHTCRHDTHMNHNATMCQLSCHYTHMTSWHTHDVSDLHSHQLACAHKNDETRDKVPTVLCVSNVPIVFSIHNTKANVPAEARVTMCPLWGGFV